MLMIESEKKMMKKKRGSWEIHFILFHLLCRVCRHSRIRVLQFFRSLRGWTNRKKTRNKRRAKLKGRKKKKRNPKKRKIKKKETGMRDARPKFIITWCDVMEISLTSQSPPPVRPFPWMDGLRGTFYLSSLVVILSDPNKSECDRDWSR